MDEEVAAYIHKRAPGNKWSEWDQRGRKRLLAELERSKPSEYDLVMEECRSGIPIGYRILPADLGQYGYDTGFHYAPDIAPQVLEEIEDVEDSEALCTEWYEVLVTEMQTVIEEDIEASLFTPKEMATFIASRHPQENEKSGADALDISVGTFRGKLGRVKEKLAKARSTLVWDEVTQGENPEEWKGEGQSASPEVIDYVDEERLPVRAGHKVVHGDELDYDIEDLILD